jgi:hypothetical protein
MLVASMMLRKKKKEKIIYIFLKMYITRSTQFKINITRCAQFWKNMSVKYTEIQNMLVSAFLFSFDFNY